MADPYDTTTPGKSPAFQFYPKDFLTDENVRVMSLQERGAYITLICLCWLEGTLPSNMGRLARLCGVPLTAFRRMWPALETCFRQHAERNDRLVHPRLERERQLQTDYRRRQSDASRKRWDKPQASVGNAVASVRDMPTASSPSPSPSPSPDSGQKSAGRGVGGGVMAGSLPRDHVNCRQPCVRVCLSEKQHGILRERHGGSDADLDAFYADVRARLDPAVPIGERPWAFWEAQFNAKFGATAVVNPRTAGNPAAAEIFKARRSS